MKAKDLRFIGIMVGVTLGVTLAFNIHAHATSKPAGIQSQGVIRIENPDDASNPAIFDAEDIYNLYNASVRYANESSK